MDFLNSIIYSIILMVSIAVLLLPKHTGYETGLVRVLWRIRIAVLNVWLTAASVLYFVGNFFVLLLLPFGAFISTYPVYVQLSLHGAPESWQSIYELIKAISEDKSVWAGGALVTTSTVALAHMWKLNLDKKQYLEKQRKEQDEESKSRRTVVKRGMPMWKYRQMTSPQRPNRNDR